MAFSPCKVNSLAALGDKLTYEEDRANVVCLDLEKITKFIIEVLHNLYQETRFGCSFSSSSFNLNINSYVSELMLCCFNNQDKIQFKGWSMAGYSQKILLSFQFHPSGPSTLKLTLFPIQVQRELVDELGH